MKDLKAPNPGLVWSVTVPVLPSGLDGNGTNLLRDAQSMGVTIPLVNIMAMLRREAPCCIPDGVGKDSEECS